MLMSVTSIYLTSTDREVAKHLKEIEEILEG
jgi:hypothetical protein